MYAGDTPAVANPQIDRIRRHTYTCRSSHPEIGKNGIGTQCFAAPGNFCWDVSLQIIKL